MGVGGWTVERMVGVSAVMRVVCFVRWVLCLGGGGWMNGK